MNQPRIHAPDIPRELEWVGTRVPIALAALRGNVVVLHFWTSG